MSSVEVIELPEKSHSMAKALVKYVLKSLQKAKHGQLELEFPDGEIISFGQPNAAQAKLKIHNFDVLKKLKQKGELGFGEAYMDGDWSSPNIADLVEWTFLNDDVMATLLKPSWLSRQLERFKHKRNANTKAGSKKNIEYHYDLGNDFYKLWLDPSMTYSSAYFKEDNLSLEQAQNEKYQRLVDWLNPQDGQRFLEVGCGWGGFAERLLSQHKVTLDGITLSHEQLAYAKNRLDNAALKGTANMSLTDYRDVTGQYDGIASIEMFEAVGEEYWPSYFQMLHDRLKPGGKAVLQVITVADERFEAYRKKVDFMQTYIFPGGMLPSQAKLKEQAHLAGLKVNSLEDFGTDYGRTLAKWNDDFQAAWPQIKNQDAQFDKRFKRMWEYYLLACEGSFRTGTCNSVCQIELVKPYS